MPKKQVYIRALLYTFMVCFAVGLAACAKKSSNNSRIAAARGAGDVLPIGGNGINGVNGVNGAACGTAANQWAQILSGTGGHSDSFRQTFQDYLQTELGDLDGTGSGQTGAEIQLKVRLNGGQLVAQESAVTLHILDSIAVQDPSQDIEIQYRGATQAQGTANGGIQLVFQDNVQNGQQPGYLIIQAQTQGQSVVGQVSYQNPGMSAPQLLGNFTQSACSVWY